MAQQSKHDNINYTVMLDKIIEMFNYSIKLLQAVSIYSFNISMWYKQIF